MGPLYYTVREQSSLCYVRPIGQHGLVSREASGRKVGSRSVRRAVPGYSLLVHAAGSTEGRKCPPLGCRIRKLVGLRVTTACCATRSVGHSAVRQGRWRCWQNGFNRPVLKHGPRSLAYVRVFGCQTRNA